MQTAPHGFNALTVFLGAPIIATWDKPSVHSVRVQILRNQSMDVPQATRGRNMKGSF